MAELISLFSSDECMRTTRVDSGVKHRLKLKGDPETERSNRWWQVGNNGGMAATRWLMGLLRECWSLLAIPAVFTWMTHIPVDIYAHTNVYTRAFLPPEKTCGPTSFFRAPIHSETTVRRISPSLELASLVFNGKPQSICLPFETSDTC